MRYKILGHEIRSENSAKHAGQASAYVTKLLTEFSGANNVLDYGCGKLRYGMPLSKIGKTITFVDSEVQLSRRQIIGGKETTVRDYVTSTFTRSRVFNISEFSHDRRRYGFALCANVLSAIPRQETRARVLRLLSGRLTKQGRCLIIAQYTNSYFSKQLKNKRVRKYADGFIKGGPSNASFYGLIKPRALNALVVRSGLAIERHWINDQSGYVIASRR